MNPLFSYLQNIGLGGLMFGMAKEFSHQLNDAEITQKVHQGNFYKPHDSSILSSKEQNIVTEAATAANNIVDFKRAPEKVKAQEGLDKNKVPVNA